MTNHRKQGVSDVACFNSYLGLKRVPSEFPVMQQQVSWATRMGRLTSEPGRKMHTPSKYQIIL